MIEGPETSARLACVKANIESAARRANRSPSGVRLIAISKTHDARAIEPLLVSGQRIFGENRVQEAAEKWPDLRARYDGIELHLVGQLQSNKSEEAVALFDCIHSVDRISVIHALSKAMGKLSRWIPIFVQVNIGEEAQKGGCAIAELPELLALARNAHLQVIGLMAVPPLGLEPSPYFALLAKLAREHNLPKLSMGMSDDYESAITLGATHVRVGTALFGSR